MEQNINQPQSTTFTPSPVQPLPQTPILTTPATSPSTSKSKVMFISIIGLLVLVGVVFAIIKIGNKQIPNQQPLATQPTASPQTTVISTASTTSLTTTPSQKAGVIEGNVTVTNTIPGLTIEEITILIVRKGSKEDPFGATLVTAPKDNAVWIVQNVGEKTIYSYKLTVESGQGIWAGQTYLVSPSIRWLSKDRQPTTNIAWRDLQKEVLVPESSSAQQNFNILIK